MTGEHEIRVIPKPSRAATRCAVDVCLAGELDIATEAHLAERLYEVVLIASQGHVDITNVSLLDATLFESLSLPAPEYEVSVAPFR